MSDIPMVTIPRELAQALHSYLMDRPMVEVEHLVVGLRQAKPVPDPGQALNAE